MGNLPSDLRVANCASCGNLLAADPRQHNHDLPRVAGRIKGRPYCAACLRVGSAGVSGLCGGMPTDYDSPSPMQENVNRSREDGPRA